MKLPENWRHNFRDGSKRAVFPIFIHRSSVEGVSVVEVEECFSCGVELFWFHDGKPDNIEGLGVRQLEAFVNEGHRFFVASVVLL